MTVYTIPEVKQYLNDLITILYEKGYFIFEDTANKYIDDLLDDIINNLPAKLKKRAPSYFDKYGERMYYAAFKKNRRTTWYAFFRIYKKDGELYYQVRYITNNHVIAQYL